MEMVRQVLAAMVAELPDGHVPEVVLYASGLGGLILLFVGQHLSDRGVRLATVIASWWLGWWAIGLDQWAVHDVVMGTWVRCGLAMMVAGLMLGLTDWKHRVGLVVVGAWIGFSIGTSGATFVEAPGRVLAATAIGVLLTPWLFETLPVVFLPLVGSLAILWATGEPWGFGWMVVLTLFGLLVQMFAPRRGGPTSGSSSSAPGDMAVNGAS